MAPGNDRNSEGRTAFQVGEWRVEPDLDRIARDDERVTLRPRVTELLVCLAAHGDTLATKQQLMDAVWQTECVTVNALTHLIAELRSALGDDAENPRYIETIPRRGYRLMAPTTYREGKSTARRGEEFRFLLVDEDGNEVGLREGENIIGRSPDAEVRVNTSEVSRRHARILIEGKTASIEDLASKNGTAVRGRRIEDVARLQDADEIQIGANLARFRFKVVDDETRTEKGSS